jgi:hypothetical protein
MTELASSLLHEASISWKVYGVSDVQKISPVYKTQHTLPLSVAGGSYPNQNYPCEISSSHGGEYDVQSCLLGYTAV